MHVHCTRSSHAGMYVPSAKESSMYVHCCDLSKSAFRYSSSCTKLMYLFPGISYSRSEAVQQKTPPSTSDWDVPLEEARKKALGTG